VRSKRLKLRFELEVQKYESELPVAPALKTNSLACVPNRVKHVRGRESYF